MGAFESVKKAAVAVPLVGLSLTVVLVTLTSAGASILFGGGQVQRDYPLRRLGTSKMALAHAWGEVLLLTSDDQKPIVAGLAPKHAHWFLRQMSQGVNDQGDQAMFDRHFGGEPRASYEDQLQALGIGRDSEGKLVDAEELECLMLSQF